MKNSKNIEEIQHNQSSKNEIIKQQNPNIFSQFSSFKFSINNESLDEWKCNEYGCHSVDGEVKIEPQEYQNYPLISSKISSNDQTPSLSKTKKILKNHQLHNKKIPRIKTLIPANSNQRLINIIVSSFSFDNQINFKQDYVKLYKLKGQRQNVVILPFLVLDCVLRQVRKMYISDTKEKIIIKQLDPIQKIKFLIDVLKNIFSHFKLSLQKTQNNKTKKNLISQFKTQQSQLYIEISDYFEVNIPEIFIKYVTERYQIEKEHLESLVQEKPKQFNDLQEVKIEDEAQMKLFYPLKEQKQEMKAQNRDALNLIIAYEGFLDQLFQTKQRQVQKAKDKFFSICLNEPHLREIFCIKVEYILNIKEILFHSIHHEYEKQCGRRKNAHPQYMKDVYEKINKCRRCEKSEVNAKGNVLGQDFLEALMVVSLLKEKNVKVLNEFIDSIKRKTEFFEERKEAFSQESNKYAQENMLLYSKSHYNHFLSLLSRGNSNWCIKTCEKEKNQQKKLQLKRNKTGECLNFELRQWIYPPFYSKKNSVVKIEQQEIMKLRQFHLVSLERMLQHYFQVKAQMLNHQVFDFGIELRFTI